MPSKYKVGVIIGCYLDDMDIIGGRLERPVTTIFGDPSGVLIECVIEGMECALISRDGISHRPPNMINYRANIWALKEAGCSHVVDMVTAGSLKEDIKPGDYIFPDNLLDFTHSRKHSFYDGEPGSLPGALYLPMNPPFSEPLRKYLLQASSKANVKCKDGGTAVTINGPRFSTKIESKLFSSMGGDFVTMVLSSEAILSKEAGMLYVPIVFIADYDTWKDGGKLNQRIINKVKSAYMDKTVKLLAACIRQIGTKDWDKEIEDLKKEIGMFTGKCGCKNIKKK